MANLRKTRKKATAGISRTAMLKRKLYKAAIKGLITLIVMAITYNWFINFTTEVINKRVEKYQSGYRNKNSNPSTESEEKQNLFKAQYKKPLKCYDITDHETRIDCSNHYIRAREAFESEQANLANQ